MRIKFGILTISDRSAQGERLDASGPALQAEVLKRDWQVLQHIIVPDELSIISDQLVAWADSGEVNVILTTGGTGFSPRDITPEATQAVIERSAPGLVEAMRYASLKITSHAMLSRAAAGIRGHTLIVNLPGSPKAAVENFEVIAPVLMHAVQLLQEDKDAEAGHRI